MNSRRAFVSGAIAVLGRPNAGKSTLLNCLMGQNLAAVSPKAQTTRIRTSGILTDKRIGQLILLDTPGLLEAKNSALNKYMLTEIRQALEGIEGIVLLVDARSQASHEQEVFKLAISARVPVVLAINKCDLSQGDLLERELVHLCEQERREFRAIHRICAKNAKGVRKLLKTLWEILPEHPPYFPDAEQISDKPMRFFAAEKIREQLFLQLRQEIPYASAVVLDKFKEDKDLTVVEATILVAKESHKPIVVGAGGRQVKALGVAARCELESLLGKKVYLGLRVKVREDWMSNDTQIERVVRAQG